MLGNALMRPFFNNKSTNAFSCLLNALPSAEVNIAIIVFALLALVELGDATNARIVASFKDLSDKYKTTVSIDIEIDENLVGGVVIKEGVFQVLTPCLHMVYLAFN
jgi:F0F1-type ATP synthase delta subunit